MEDYIRNNRHLFDEEPEAGHLERLQQKMNRTNRRTIALRWVVSVAATVLLLFSAGSVWLHIHNTKPIIVCENMDNMKQCYLDKMNVVANQIEELTRDFDQWDQQQVMGDVQNIIDATSNGLENEIPEELPDDATKSILADYYRQNLEGLNSIVKKLKK